MKMLIAILCLLPSLCFGQSFDFVRATGHLLDLQGDLNFIGRTHAFSYTAWFNVDSTNVFGGAIIGRASNSQGQYDVQLGPGTVAVQVGSVQSCLTAAGVITNGVWYFVAVTIPAASSGALLYINGKVPACASGVGNIGTATAPRDTTIGATRDTSNGNSKEEFGGQIDDVRMYARVLEPEEIVYMFHTRGQDGIYDGLVVRHVAPVHGFITTDRVLQQGEVLKDISASNNNATVRFNMNLVPGIIGRTKSPIMH